MLVSFPLVFIFQPEDFQSPKPKVLMTQAPSVAHLGEACKSVGSISSTSDSKASPYHQVAKGSPAFLNFGIPKLAT